MRQFSIREKMAYHLTALEHRTAFNSNAKRLTMATYKKPRLYKCKSIQTRKLTAWFVYNIISKHGFNGLLVCKYAYIWPFGVDVAVLLFSWLCHFFTISVSNKLFNDETCIMTLSIYSSLLEIFSSNIVKFISSHVSSYK